MAQQQMKTCWDFSLNKSLVSNFVTVSLIIVFKSSTTFAQITTRPLDATALVGQGVQLHCRSQEILDWYFVPGAILDDSEYNRRCNKFRLDHCLMITSNGQLTDEGKQRYTEFRQISLSGSPRSTLSFEAVDMSYAGAYRCEGGRLDNAKLNAFVTLIDQNPSCTKLPLANSSDDVQLRCWLAYAGKAPTLKWKLAKSSQLWTECVDEDGGILCVTQFPAISNEGDIICLFGDNSALGARSNESRIIDVFESNTKFNTTLHCSVVFTEYKTILETVNTFVSDTAEKQGQSLQPHSVSLYPLYVYIGPTLGLVIIAAIMLIVIIYLKRRNKKPIEKAPGRNYEDLDGPPTRHAEYATLQTQQSANSMTGISNYEDLERSPSSNALTPEYAVPQTHQAENSNYEDLRTPPSRNATGTEYAALQLPQSDNSNYEGLRRSPSRNMLNAEYAALQTQQSVNSMAGVSNYEDLRRSSSSNALNHPEYAVLQTHPSESSNYEDLVRSPSRNVLSRDYVALQTHNLAVSNSNYEDLARSPSTNVLSRDYVALQTHNLAVPNSNYEDLARSPSTNALGAEYAALQLQQSDNAVNSGLADNQYMQLIDESPVIKEYAALDGLHYEEIGVQNLS